EVPAAPRTSFSPQAAPDYRVDDDTDTQGWKCPRCGTRLSHEYTACPSCGAALEAVQTPKDYMLAPRATAVGPEEQGIDVEGLQTRFADDLASRAYRAAIVGCLILPVVLHLYSGWLLLRLSVLPGKLSPSARRQALLAAAIDVPILVLGGLIVKFLFF